MEALALTDHGVMYGAIDFYSECKKNGVKPIIGCEVYVACRSRLQKEAHIDDKRYHLTLLAKNNTGYQNLVKLTTFAHLEGFYYKPRVDKELLRRHSEGIITLSGCPGGELGRAIQVGNMDRAREIIREHQKIFGSENYFLEIMHHPDMEWFKKWKDAIVELSREMKIPMAATQDSHYLKKDDALAHKTLVAVSTNTDVAETAIFSGNGEYHFISPEEARERFVDIPEAVENTLKIADACNVELTLGKFIFPNFALEDGKTADQMLAELSLKGAKERKLENDEEIVKRMNYELEVIKNKGYAPYFLVVADLMRFAREAKIYTTVRGSTAGSLVAYLSGITNINPIDYQLPFERFLNPFRPSAPDIDMDFADDRRQEVIEYAKQKYDEDKVAQIGTFGTMLARGAVRDVARAMGKPYDAGDRVARLIPMGSQGFPMTIGRALELESELKKLYDLDPEAREIIDTARRLEGTVRHVSVHAAGVVIAPKPLIEYVPLQYDPKGGSVITQYDMYAVGEDGIGLTKLDFLGIRNLAILEDAVRLVRERKNIEIDIEKIPLDDASTFEMLAKGETEGLFQLNGDGMTKYLVELKPTTIHDINAMIALYRPGPINNIPEYIARKHGKSPVRYFHPKTEKFLQKSYGILVYQDDLLLTALELAGYNWESVDKFRKAVGKKIPEEMARQHDIFIEGCQKHSGISKNEAEKIWGLFEPFQGYGFNKAHAACYGRVAYQTAYMKAKYPAEYMCAVLTAESGDTEKIAEIIAECKRMQIPVLPPDINTSFEDFTVVKSGIGQDPLTNSEQDQIRFGLFTVKNVGANIVSAIIEERKINGPYFGLTDLLERVKSKDLNKKSLESLVKSGALDALGERNQMLANMETILAYRKDAVRTRAQNQSSLFGLMNQNSIPTLKLQKADPAPFDEKIKWEKELLGLYVSGHPLDRLRVKLEKEKMNINTAKSLAEGAPAMIAGCVQSIKKILTKNGEPMAFLKILDFSGSLEALVFPRALQKFGHLIREETGLKIKGRISRRNNQASIIANEIRTL